MDATLHSSEDFEAAFEESVGAIRAALSVRLGAPDAVSGRAAVWTINPEGDAIVAARVNGAGTAESEAAKALRQIDAGRAALGGQVRLVIAGLGISGVAARSERPDLDRIEQEAAADACRAVYWHERDRISRDPRVLFAHVEALRHRGVSLFLDE